VVTETHHNYRVLCGYRDTLLALRSDVPARTSRISRVQTRRIQIPKPIGAPREMAPIPSAEKSAKAHHLFHARMRKLPTSNVCRCHN
jgi:hypothetical protein